MKTKQEFSETEINYQFEIVEEFKKALCDVIMVEGKIKTAIKLGNQIIIRFENGNVYEQRLITKAKGNKVTLD